MSWLEDYGDWDDNEYHVRFLPIEADLAAWVKDGEESMDSLAHGESFPYDLPSANLDLSMTQEDTDIGEEILDA